MREIQPDLWETEVENPFPGLYTHAYLLVREGGNILFYNTSHDDEFERMVTLGGVAYQFLSHWDELGESVRTIASRFGAKLGGHRRERSEISAYREPDILFDRREVLLGNIEIIPTPGHSPGSTCFFVRSPHGKRYLFTGDTLWLNRAGVLSAALLQGSNLKEYIESLATLRELEPDLVISSATDGGSGVREIRAREWPKIVDDALEPLLRKSGASRSADGDSD